MWAGWLEMVVQGLALDFSTPISPEACTHPGAKGDELENTLEGEAHGEGEVHVGEQIPQDQGRSVKLNTGKDKTRMKKGIEICQKLLRPPFLGGYRQKIY